MSCTYQGVGVTYDFTPLSTSTGYLIRDSRNNTGPVYDYYFSVCNNMQAPGSSAGGQTPSSMCNSTVGSDGAVMTGPGPAFIVGYNQASCQRLGDSAANGIIVPDPYNAAHGATLAYANGDKCAVFAGGTLNFIARSINVNFICSISTGILPPFYDVVRQTTSCQYDAYVYSSVGCPTECTRGGPQGKPCSANGVCDWDSSKNAARCFCNSGYSGNDCTVPGDKGLPPAPSFGGNIAGGFFGGIFAGLAVMLGYFAYSSYNTGASFVDSIKIGGGGAGVGGLGGSRGGYVAASASYEDAYTANAANYAGAGAGSGYVAPSFGANADKDLLVT